jgi:hypothetical protein
MKGRGGREIVKVETPGPIRPRFRWQLCNLPIIWPWTSYLAFLCQLLLLWIEDNRSIYMRVVVMAEWGPVCKARWAWTKCHTSAPAVILVILVVITIIDITATATIIAPARRQYSIGTKSINLGWQSGSSGKVPAYQVQGPEFKLPYCKKKKKINSELDRLSGIPLSSFTSYIVLSSVSLLTSLCLIFLIWKMYVLVASNSKHYYGD